MFIPTFIHTVYITGIRRHSEPGEKFTGVGDRGAGGERHRCTQQVLSALHGNIVTRGSAKS